MEIIVTGLEELTVKIEQMPTAIRGELVKTMGDITSDLENRVVANKLAGQVLKRVTGRLYKSVRRSVVINDVAVIGSVLTSGVPYAKIHEYGGTVKTRLGTGVNKPKAGGKATITFKERSYMRSSLKDMRGDILKRLSVAVGEVVKK